MLSPNALRVLDSLGVYERIRRKGYNFETLAFKNESDETTDVYYFGHEKLYGYKGLRIYRQVLINELVMMLEECGMDIRYEKKFSNVVSESDEGVEFGFADRSTASASLLIGADGIHSRVRRYILPSIAPLFSGHLAITSAIERSKLRIPAGVNYQLPVTISAEPGGFVLAPQDVEGSEVLVGTQLLFPERNRAGWEQLLACKDELLQLFRKDMTAWPDIVQSALENVNKDKINIWPFYVVPKLDQWASPKHRVVILGDAAHAIPPTAGQGVNQAFEDVYMLALLLSNLSSTYTLPAALQFWQNYRQERIDKVLDLTRQMNAKRLPAIERAKLVESSIWKDESSTRGEGGQLRWLYDIDLDEVVDQWVREQQN